MDRDGEDYPVPTDISLSSHCLGLRSEMLRHFTFIIIILKLKEIISDPWKTSLLEELSQRTGLRDQILTSTKRVTWLFLHMVSSM